MEQIRDHLNQPAFSGGRWALCQVLLLIIASSFPCAAAGYEKEIRPLLKEYCLGCHSTEKHKGDLDLERFTSLNEVMKHPRVWQSVVEQISLGEMPPKDKPQPSAAQRARLLVWANVVLDDAARARAGDPGPVVLRRLSNAEYTWTLRDLTGIESLDPAKEFPADSASGEGFMNVGNSLVMSPSLVTKYLDAAKEIAHHAVLLPDGIRFSPKNTGRDWTEELLAQIRGAYREFTDNGGGTSVNLQGIRFDTKDGGVLPLDKYLAATLEVAAGVSPAVEPGFLPGGKGVDGSNRAAKSSVRPSDKKPPAAAGGTPAATAQRLNAFAVQRGLSPKYLATLWNTLNSTESSLLLDPIRARWRSAKPGDAAVLAKEISQWQHALWKFNSVGHIGKRDGPKAWMEPLTPIQSKQELRFKIPVSPEAKEITFYVSASDAGDGNNGDYVIWEQPRLVAPGRPTLLLRDVRNVNRELSARRERTLSATAKYLAAAAQAEAGKTNVAELARQHGVDAGALAAWLDYLGVSSSGPVKVEGHFTDTFTNGSGYAFINGWGKSGTPNLVANSSDQQVRIPGNMKPHSVAVHPSPTLTAGVGWRSPMAGKVRVEAAIQHAHPECGNGVIWSLELRHGSKRQRLANGTAQGAKEVKPAPIENVTVQPGDLVSLLIGPRDGNHSCDLTAVDLTLISTGEAGREWDLARDVSPDVLAGNPHADRFGNEGVWHFYTEPDKAGPLGPVIPAGSLLAKWQASESAEEKQKLADAVEQLLTSAAPAIKDSPDAVLCRQLTSVGGPLFTRVAAGILPAVEPGVPPGGKTAESFKSATKSGTIPGGKMPPSTAGETPAATWALDPAQFGKHPNGSAIDAVSLCVRAPDVIEIRLPSDLVAGYEFVTTGVLDGMTGAEGSVQFQLLTNKPAGSSGLLTIEATTKDGEGPWYSNNRTTSHNTPIIVNDGSAARKRIEAAFDEFRQVFPAALCYTKIVPVDEVVTLTLFYREDHHFKRLMLDDTQAARLDRLWDELHYVARDALTLVDVFEQLWQYATQDADPSVFEPMREPIKQRAAAFRQRLVDTQPAHLDAVLKFADSAYRRPLTGPERDELRGLYRKLRAEEIPHEEAIRLTLARVLVAPAFVYRTEKPGPGEKPGPVNDWELATRLSYFLWSSAPDAELRALAASGKLRKPGVLAAQTGRMLRDPRVRRLAVEFACAWLHIYDFDQLGEKSERHFPTFNGLRDAMYEETIRFFTDLFQNDGPVLNILDADYTFLNEDLAKHYGIPDSVFRSSRREEAHFKLGTRNSEPGTGQSLGTSAATAADDGWYRVAGVKRFSRGGILGQATTLAKQSGASRTSPILRGNWVAEVLLGEKLPRPPKDVPQLPEDEATETLTVRQLTEKHSTDPKCYGCHRRIDPYGYSLEAFDAIGRFRDRDLGGRPIETGAKTMDGVEFDGLDGLRDYLLTKRRDAFLKQFCRKLLGYSLGRAVQLSDGPLISEMQKQLRSNGYRISAAVETIVWSKQFREIRGKEMASEE
ncbi:MAG TPA: DUF1592 domain-containing protein [Verrucomicrobiae bacterium]|nr:DUF1592 domain-containing protein [Verrucomicrobiae bacterium]